HRLLLIFTLFLYNAPAPTEIYTLSLHDALPISEKAVEGMSIVFHLAADHGGRGYVDLHQAACASNLMFDGLIFRACHRAGVDKRSEEHTSELQSRFDLVCRLLLEKKKKTKIVK